MFLYRFDIIISKIKKIYYFITFLTKKYLKKQRYIDLITMLSYTESVIF